MIPECDRAYIAGLFDGEGCVSYKQYNRKRAHNKKAYPTWQISCLLYTSPSPRDAHESRMPSSA